MPNDSIKHGLPATDPRNHQRSTKSAQKRNAQLAKFLIDTNILPLALIGKGLKTFGGSAVLGFILGGLTVYGYAVVKPLPLAKVATESIVPTTPTPAPPKMVRLRGVVRDAKLRPMTDRFWVGVLANQLGPVQNPEGEFALEVPQSNSYDIALWTSPEEVSFFNRFTAEQDDKGLKLEQALPLLATVRTTGVHTGRARPSLNSNNAIARSFVER
jgi:hypothetical protein